jgi:hypothetical protein
MSDRATTEQPGDWLVATVRRNPEAFLVLAAGCALLMRSKGERSDASRHEGQYYREAERPPWTKDDQVSGAGLGGGLGQAGNSVRDYASSATDRVADVASDVTGRVTDTAREYAAAASDYAGGMRDQVVSGASRLPDQARATVQRGFARILREQPLAIAAAGLAAGATLAAIFPATDTESQVLGPAHDAAVDAASRLADNVKSAAAETGEQLKEVARQRGLDPEGLKGLARDVAGTFADNVTGRSADQARHPNQNDAPGLVPEHTGTGT